jgi:hypothetical protein
VTSTSDSKKSPWRIATMSQDANCVQVRQDNDNDMIDIGNSRFPDGPFLSYTPAEWSAFLDGAKKGEFDDFAPR